MNCYLFILLGGVGLKYIATPSLKPVSKIQLNNHKVTSSSLVDGVRKKDAGPGTKSNGVSVTKKKTLREMLAGVPGFSNRVSYVMCCINYIY